MILGRVKRWGMALAALVAAIGAAWLGGRRSGRADERADAARARAKAIEDTHERMNDADISNGDSDADLEWLRSRSQRNNRP